MFAKSYLAFLRASVCNSFHCRLPVTTHRWWDFRARLLLDLMFLGKKGTYYFTQGLSVLKMFFVSCQTLRTTTSACRWQKQALIVDVTLMSQLITLWPYMWIIGPRFKNTRMSPSMQHTLTASGSVTSDTVTDAHSPNWMHTHLMKLLCFWRVDDWTFSQGIDGVIAYL